MDAAFKIVMRALDKPEAKRQRLSKTDRAEIVRGFNQMVYHILEGQSFDALIGWNDGEKARTIAKRLLPKQDFDVLSRYDRVVSWVAIVKDRGPKPPDQRDIARQLEAVALTAHYLADMRECARIVEDARKAADEYLKAMAALGATPQSEPPRRRTR